MQQVHTQNSLPSILSVHKSYNTDQNTYVYVYVGVKRLAAVTVTMHNKRCFTMTIWQQLGLFEQNNASCTKLTLLSHNYCSYQHYEATRRLVPIGSLAYNQSILKHLNEQIHYVQWVLLAPVYYDAFVCSLTRLLATFFPHAWQGMGNMSHVAMCSWKRKVCIHETGELKSPNFKLHLQTNYNYDSHLRTYP